MTKYRQIAEELIAEAERLDDFRAGIAPIEKVLDGPSYRASADGEWKTDHSEKPTPWLPNAGTLLVLAMHHPENNPQLDWFDRGNTAGNRRMTKVSEELAAWLFENHGVQAQPLPYHVERGGVYLKDAAVSAGLGVVGKDNLLLDRKWGPRVRLRAILIEGRLPAFGPTEKFDPCDDCPRPCRKACPQNAFAKGEYGRPPCLERLEADRANPIESGQTDSEGSPILVTKWCRKCELTCPAGK